MSDSAPPESLLAEYRAALRRLLSTEPLAVLATAGDEAPHASLIAFAVTPDLKALFFATPRATRKFSRLLAEAHVALLVDDRSRRAADFHEATAVTIHGRAAEVGATERASAAAMIAARHSYLEDFLASASCAIVRVEIDSFSVVRRFQNVMILSP
jgi:nitroimidazol reductase NimA-like FMN-containing flavoprotein (pyridoxamine 5'-phosphate oxidase superfamily)